MNLPMLLSIMIPTLTVLLGILLNRNDYNNLRSEVRGDIQLLRREMQQLRSDVRGEIQGLRVEMGQLRDSIHRDMVILHERVAVVEAKQA